MDDRELLHQYVAGHSEPAFAELVARHLPFVLATALRLVREPQAAADVAQTVFIQLARRAWTIRPEQVLSGWLYRATRHHALNALRAEQRRLHRETLAMKFAETENAADHAWETLAPLVDEAMHQLKRGEQDAVLLRFFEEKSYGEVGRILDLDEKTASQRVNRALEKMRLHFSRRGVTTTAALLGAALSAHAAAPTPAELAANLAGASLARAGGAAVSGSLLKTLYMTITTKTALVVAAIVAVAALTTIHQQREISTLRTQLADATLKAHSSAAAKKPTLAELEVALKKLISMPHEVDTYNSLKALNTFSDEAIKKGDFADFAKTLDPASARALLDFVEKMPATYSTQIAEAVLLGVWAKGSPEAALTWAQSHLNKFDRREAYYAIFSGWAENDPEAALTALDQAGLPALSSKLKNEILSTATALDPQRGLQLFSALPPAEQSTLGFDFLDPWDSNDPAAAAAALANLPPSAARDQELGRIAMLWSGQDNQAVLSFIDAFPPGNARNNMLDAVYGGQSQWDNPQDAMALIGNLPDGPQRDKYVSNFIDNPRSSSAIDVPSALAWVEQVTAPGPAQDDAVSGLVESAFRQSLTTANNLLDQISSSTTRNAIIPELAVAEVAMSNPLDAITWVQSLPDDANTQQQAINYVVTAWTRLDPAAAADYIEQNLSSAPNYGKLVAQAANSWAGLDPAAAFTWVESLSPGPAQDNAMRSVVSTYAKLAPAAATEAVQSASLTDEQRSALLAVIQNATAAK